jgi:hypothetical protein
MENKIEKKINRKDFNYSHIGEASAKKYLYLLDKKKHLNNLLKGKKRAKLVTDDFIHQEEKDVYDELYEKDDYEEDIFDKDYKNKYVQILEEQKQKYFNLKKSCSFLTNDEQKEISQYKKEENKKISKKKILDRFENDKFKYHLIHHHHDYYLDKALLNANGAEPACTSYNPKMEYIFKKIIYSPEFKKMSGRYDHDNLRDKIEQQIEKNIKEKREKESKIYQKKLEKIRSSMNMTHKEDNLKNKENENKVNLSKRHNSAVEKINKNIRSLFKKASQDKIAYNNNINNNNEDETNNNESRNFSKKLFKRTNTMVNNEPKLFSFGFGNNNNSNNNKSNKNSFENYIKNIEEYENEEDNYDFYEKKEISNNIDGNTLSSANQYKTTSGKKKDISVNYINNETDIIYPYNVSKNDSNIVISNNYSFKKLKNAEINNNINNNNNNINNSVSFYENIPSKKKLTNILRNYRNNSYISNKQNILPTLNTNNKVVNFEKMLSREYVRKINERKKNIYSSLSPNYESIRPKCIMKVIYAQKYYKKNRKGEFKSNFNEFVFDINKHFNNYNNHSPPKDIFLGKMTGRELNNKSHLPSYMVRQYNRNAFNTFNEKSLEMNNFANGDLKVLKSSFNDKKSFNHKLNEQYFNNDNNDIVSEKINTIMRKIKKPLYNKKEYGEHKSLSCSNIYDNNRYRIFGNTNLFRTKMPEYYKVNLDKLGKYPYSNGEKIDGFTLKTIKSNKSSIDLLTDYEKSIFLSRLNE